MASQKMKYCKGYLAKGGKGQVSVTLAVQKVGWIRETSVKE